MTLTKAVSLSLAAMIAAAGCYANPPVEKAAEPARARPAASEDKPYEKWGQNLEPNVVAERRYADGYAGKTLRIWFDLRHVNDGFHEVARRFETKKNAKVIVESPDSPLQEYALRDDSRKPDILCGNHDRIPRMAADGIIQPVRPSRSTFDEQVKLGWNAMSDHDTIYGYPIAASVITLFYNPWLLSQPPKDLDELDAVQKKLENEGIDALRFDYLNPYFSWPLIAAVHVPERSYIYGRGKDGEYDPSDVGIATRSAVEGLERFKSLIDRGLLPKGEAASYGAMERGFNAGKVAMMINGPWAIDDLIASGLPVVLAPLPKVSGATPRPFVQFYGCMLSQAAQFDIATDFLENHLLKPEALGAIDPNHSLGVSNNKAYFKRNYHKPYFQAMFALVNEGLPMPDTDYMGLFWKHAGTAIRETLTGRQGAEEALEAAADRMRR